MPVHTISPKSAAKHRFTSRQFSEFRHQRVVEEDFPAHSWATQANRCGKFASRFGTWRLIRNRRCGAHPTRALGAPRRNAAHVLNQRFGPAAVMTGAQLRCVRWKIHIKIQRQNVRSCGQRGDGEETWGTDADPLAQKGDWEKRLSKVSKQSQFRH